MLDAPISEYSLGNGHHVRPEVIKLIVSPPNIMLLQYTLANDDARCQKGWYYIDRAYRGSK